MTNVLLAGNVNTKVVVLKSLVFSGLAIGVMYALRVFLHTDLYISDVGGIGVFTNILGVLYGIMAAFVVFEVWGQYNKTSELIDKEALGLERLFRLTLYLSDKKLKERMKKAIKEYINLVVKSRFVTIAKEQRNTQIAENFRKIANVIRGIKLYDKRDPLVFDQIAAHYGHLHEIRTERLNQSLTRLPPLLKIFLYLSSFLVLLTFLIMPFSNIYYGFIVVGIIAFTILLVFQIVEDLDNPFLGYWNLTPEPFARALKHIEESY